MRPRKSNRLPNKRATHGLCVDERRVIMEERICGYCAYHSKDDRDWMCVNERSDNYGDYTGFTDRCPDLEGREDDGYVTRQ